MSSNIGFGVMLDMLAGGFGGDAAALKKAMGKEIASMTIGENEAGESKLTILFTDNTGLILWDNGQSCCEDRHVTTDDPLVYFLGSTLVDVEIRDAPESEDEWGNVHEIQFLLVTTSKGVITFQNHNIHNGYYGGFSIRAKEYNPAGLKGQPS